MRTKQDTLIFVGRILSIFMSIAKVFLSSFEQIGVFREYNGFLVSHYLYEPSWNLLNRNTIRFGRFRYKIISVSDNRILIRNDIDPKNAVDTLELVPKSHIPKDYRDFQKPFQYKEEKKDREKGKYFFIF